MKMRIACADYSQAHNPVNRCARFLRQHRFAGAFFLALALRFARSVKKERINRHPTHLGCYRFSTEKRPNA